MPAASRLLAKALLERPGFRESGFARTSITVFVPAAVRRSTNSPTLRPSLPHVWISLTISLCPPIFERHISYRLRWRNFLCQHDVACDEITFGRKAPTNTRTAGAVELADVHRDAVANPVSLSAVAAGDVKIAFRVILRELLSR